MPSSKEELKNRPEAKNLIGIYSSLINSTLEKLLKNFLVKIFQNLKRFIASIS